MARYLRVSGLLTAVLVAALVLAACGGGGAAAPSDGSGTTEAAGSGDTGAAACPEPNPKMEVTSKELNLFVWTEYIPQQTIDCFE